MRITDLLDVKSICLDASPASKEESLNQAIDLMTKSGKINDVEAYKLSVFAREEEGTTGVGEGIAIPHGRGASVSKPGLAAMVIKNGVDFESLDEKPVHLLFLIAAPNTKDNIHLDVLSKLSTLLMDEIFVANLKAAKTVEEFLSIVDKADAEIAEADFIIIATDTQVPMDRFHGKKLIECQVSDGISKAEELVARAIKGDGTIYKAGNPAAVKTTQTSVDSDTNFIHT